MSMRLVLLLSFVACRSEDAEPKVPPVTLLDAAAPAPPTAAPPKPAPFVPPHLALETTTVEGPKGDTPALGIVPQGFPALSEDDRTYVTMDVLDYYGHSAETAPTAAKPLAARTRKSRLFGSSASVATSASASRNSRSDVAPH